ncbi:VOC family protein [Knoellia sp. CPCC 206435]|uniref:VOC family protein n=1 Tax=Knoellia terrae TaxID=3404797 RepID=UPI003B435BED
MHRSRPVWAGVLGSQALEHVSDEVSVVPLEGTFDLTVRRSGLPKPGPNRIHADVTTISRRDMDERRLGARWVPRNGQGPDDAVMTDPDGRRVPPVSSTLSASPAGHHCQPLSIPASSVGACDAVQRLSRRLGRCAGRPSSDVGLFPHSADRRDRRRTN